MANAPRRESSAASGRAGAGNLSIALRRDRLRNRRMMILLLLLVTSIFVVPAILPEGTLFRLFGDAATAGTDFWVWIHASVADRIAHGDEIFAAGVGGGAGIRDESA